MSHTWFFEQTTRGEGHAHAVIRRLVDTHTKYQRVEILETVSCGRCLVLDGRMQSTEADDFIYHEALVHPGMLATPLPPRTVLLSGGGEGATLREVLKHTSVRRAVMIDIDAEVIELCREYLPRMHGGSFDDLRVEIQHRDARDYLEHSKEKVDVIISDLPEPLEAGPAVRLYTREFYRLVRDHLAYTGVFAVQAGIAKHTDMGLFAGVYRTLQEVFPNVAAYQAFVPCFGTPLGFILAGNSIDLHRQDQATVDNLIALRVRDNLRYWDGETHRHAFALPKHIRRALSNATNVGTDDNPLVVARSGSHESDVPKV